ncbi:MAG: hypothetical protein HZC42_08305 [Candidatus Eisenbacteria bacterium]|nr:hypothetical protein [Candidatus Eisenbacteria bacterium]
MKLARLIVAVAIVASAGSWAVSYAGKDRSAQASGAAHAACTAEMAKNCTPEQAAACKAKGARAGMGECPFHSGASATTAAMSGACTAEMAKKCTAEQAAACKAKGAGAAMSGACTAEMAKKCTAEQAAACKAKGASAAAAAMSAGHCGAKGAAATGPDAPEGEAAAGSSVAAGKVAAPGSPAMCQHGASAKAAATPAGGAIGAGAAGGSCSSRGTSAAAGRWDHGDCDACADMARSEDELSNMGASVQTVPLKNGVMFVYTADSPARVRGVQAALARRNERLSAMTTAGDKAKLCPDCKALRGAAASGKLRRETVNIEGGCLNLMTSDDPAVVAKIHAMTGAQTAARVKS